MGDAERASAPSRGPGSNIFVSFGPWIAVWVLTSNRSYIPGMLVATGLSIGLIVWERWSGNRPKFLDWGTLVALAVLTVVSVVVDDAWLGYWLSPLLNLAFVAVMLASVLLGRPFTEEYARETAPPEVWDTPNFTHINRVITWVWIAAGAAMAVGAAVNALLQSGEVVVASAHTVEAWANWGVTVIALVGAFKFTAWYPDAYLAKIGAAGGDGPGGDGPAVA